MPRRRLNGKVERFHRIDAEEFYRLLEGVVIDDAQVFNDKLREWKDFYNYHRPHGDLDGQTPYESSSNQPRPGRNRSSSVAHCRPRQACQELARSYALHCHVQKRLTWRR